MDHAKQAAITGCGRCGQPEDAHKFRTSVDDATLTLFAALGGPCPEFTASDAAVIWAKHLAIADNHEPRYRPGKVGKRAPLCPRCLHRGHDAAGCPL